MATQSVRIGWRPYVNLSTATYLVDTYSGSTAVYSLRKVNSTYTGPAIRVRRSSDNTESDINFKSNGDLDTTALLSFTNPVAATFSILDNYPGASAAYSLRKVRTAYTGSAIRVRRSDNQEMDIAFDISGSLDTTSLLTFVGSGNGFVTTWYDQSGNNKHIVQITAANQPYIVLNGSVQMNGNKPAIYWDNNQVLSINSGVNNIMSVFVNIKWLTGSGVSPILGNRGSVAYYHEGNSSESGLILSSTYADYNVKNGSLYLNGTLKTLSTFSKSTDSNILVSMVHLSNTAVFSQLGNDRGFVATYFKGYYSEIIIYPTNQAANRTLIESNMNGYYSIYGDAYVTKWYDQSGLARHSTQVTATYQPQIVSGCSLILRSGKPAIYFDGVDDTLRLSTPLPVSDITTLFTVAFANYENTVNDIVFGRRAAMSYRYSGGNSTVAGLCITRAESADFIYASTPASTTGLNTLAVFHTHYAFGNYDGLNRTRIYSNGVWRNDANGVGTSGFSQVEYIGSGGDCQFFKNTIQELVYYPSNQLNNRIAIENNINSYYSLWDRTAVVSNGLVLNLDASDINSYYKTGTEWFNIAATSSTIKGTLVNGPVFDTANGGSILFDGVNDYVNLGSNLKFNDSDITYDFWFKVTDNSDVYREIITIGSSNQSNSISLWKYRSGLNSGKVFANINIVGFTQTMVISQLTGADILNTIVNYTAVFKKESGVYKLYLYRNGVLDASTTSNVTSYNMNNWANFEARIGSGSSTYPELWKGNIYSGKVYNRAISDSEVLQNFNVTKSRFGL